MGIPSIKGEWRREPWPIRNYAVHDGYAIPVDVGEKMDCEILQLGLTTSLEVREQCVEFIE